MDGVLKANHDHSGNAERKDDDSFVIRESSDTKTTEVLEKNSTTSTIHHLGQIRGHADTTIDQIREAKTVESLRTCLLDLAKNAPSPIDIHIPGPAEAKVIQTWIETIIPNFWEVSDAEEKKVLLSPLKSLAGINAVTAQLRLCLDRAKSKAAPATLDQRIVELNQVLGSIFASDELVVELWHGIDPIRSTEAKHDLIWKSIVNILASGKIVAIQAEANEYLSSRELDQKKPIFSGEAYARWLAKNLVRTVIECEDEKCTTVAHFMPKIFSLGYSTIIVRELVSGLVIHDCGHPDSMVSKLVILLKSCSSSSGLHRSVLSSHKLLDSFCDWLSSISDGGSLLNSDPTQSEAVSHFARMLEIMYQADASFAQYTMTILADASTNARNSLQVRRGMIIALRETNGIRLTTIFEKALSAFGEVLFIEHAPISQQDAMLQTVLLLAGYIHRSRSADLVVATRSANYTQGISNRLSSSNTRSRWLGMTLATAISGLQDSAGSRVKFGVSDLETQETKDYLNLVHVQDKIGTVQGFRNLIRASSSPTSGVRSKSKAPSHKLPVINGKQTFGPERPPEPVMSKKVKKPAQTEIEGNRVEEISDDQDEDSDLRPYAKPDSDPEDSDEDATLVNRNKPRPPVYIRTLMAMLREGEKPDRFQLGLKHAGPLIRRKIGFGKEVSDHAEELARILANLQDPFETPGFDELRLQALIALILSDVDAIAPWLSNQALTNGYSIAQRCIMLTALGLSGRELAGLKHEDAFNPALENTSFPSKKLPARLHAIYNTNTNPNRFLQAASTSVEQAVIQPMALAAADQTTSSLDAVKVRTFSSRMNNDRTRRKPAANALAKVFARDFFTPLMNAYHQQTSAYGDASVVASNPVILGTFLKTITILLHASGPATIDLSQIRATFWHVLLSLRVKATKDVIMMEALLFSLITLLEISTDQQQMVQDHPQQLMETKEWTEMVFEGLNSSNVLSEGRSQEERIAALCAGVITKINEIIQEYQQILMGSWSEF